MNLGRLVGRDIVKHHMNWCTGLDPLGNLIKKGKEFPGSVTINHPACDLAGCDIKGGQQTGGSLPFVVMGSGLRLPRFHRQRRLCPAHRLNTRLFINGKNNRMIRRIGIKTDNIPDFLDKL